MSGPGEQAERGPDTERRERVLARALEVLSRRDQQQREHEAWLSDPDRIARSRETEEWQRRRDAPAKPVDAEPDKSSRRSIERLVDVTLARAKELCAAAWGATYVKKSNTGLPNKHGNCEGKALWLQKHLGGVVMTGFKHGRERHAVLLLPIEGKLHVADAGELTPVDEYPFFVEGFYEFG
ncbi:hypothetical protein QA649_19680 [Bradyrhizobium sp. CB1717]|uniref:hypothetical protein n=1 Tax=Bradyrhizobium sp. CB1717 TaxID=3039154 RepID=UPI0024B1F4A7|nr:hypothetical protein [Bradyrhizobium sp. CB1717]WFU28352.1 hypothetical protein QA649_19680 [Bradyrhizobium sp. CB1717]